MKHYTVEYSKAASKALLKMDKSVSRMIYGWVNRNLAGLWRYRVGNYRLIAEIHDDRLVILMLEVGHRGEIYQ